MVLFLGAMWRWFKVKVLRIEGKIEERTDELMEDPHVIDAIYRDAIKGDAQAIQRLKDAVAGLDARVTSDEALLKRLMSDSEDGLEVMNEELEGALAVGQERYAALQAQGMPDEQIQADEEFREAMEFYEDIQSTIGEREKRIADVESRVQISQEQLTERESQLRSLYRQLERLKIERTEARADAIVDKNLEEVADVLAGINVDGHKANLQRARDARAKLKGRAKLATKMAGMDTNAQRAKFRKKVATKKAHTDFMSKMRGAADVEDAGAAPAPAAKEAVTAAGPPSDDPGAGGGGGPAPLT